MTSITINGRTFADPLDYISDHCHKFWIVRDENDMNIMNRYGWTRDDLNPIEKTRRGMAELVPAQIHPARRPRRGRLQHRQSVRPGTDHHHQQDKGLRNVENGLDDVRPAANLCQECSRKPSLMPSCVHCEQCKDGRALCEGRSYHCDLCGNIACLKHGHTDMTYTPWNNQTSCSRRPSGRSAMTCNVPPMPSR